MKVSPARFAMTLALLPVSLSLFALRASAQTEIDISGLQEETTRSLSLRGSINERTPQPGGEALPEEARKLLLQLDQNKAVENNDALIRQTIQRFLKMQDQNTRANRLDEAVALRDTIQELQARLSGAMPDPGTLTAYRGQIDRSFSFLVTGRKTGSVWGTSVYTDDSDLGTAAVHAGLLREGQKGIVKVTILAGLEHYQSSDRNEITSNDYETWSGSYVVEPGERTIRVIGEVLPDEARKLLAELKPTVELNPGQPVEDNSGLLRKGIESLQKMQETYARSGKLEEAVAIRDRAQKLLVSLVGALPDPGSLTVYRGQAGQSFVFEVTGRQSGSIWGSEFYTDDSNLGTAAVHAGLLRAGQKGIVRVTMLPGSSQYQSSSRNGVSSSPYQAWEGSYRIEAVKLPTP